MSLLQISEPGEAPKQAPQKTAIGIDLGTTNSLVASIIAGEVQVLTDHNGALLPSVVQYTEHDIIVGQAAKQYASQDPLNTIASVKRLMGRGVSDIQTVNNQLPFKCSEENGMVNIQVVNQSVSPVQVSAEILKALKHRAEQLLEKPIDGVVITVPAYFDDAQRQATKDAGVLAGLNVLRLLNEPTAAAIAYGLDKKEEGIHVIYDLGGGTFDVSVLNFSRGVFHVLATGGNSALGGDDFDHLIAEWIMNQANIEALTAEQQRELSDLACQSKEQLSQAEVNHIQFLNWSGELTRDVFNQLIETLVDKTIDACKRTLKDAQVKLASIADVILVGGSTRIPYLQQRVEALFKCKPLTDLNPDTIVAEGAAIQADILIGNKPDSEMVLLDVLPLSLGIETMGGLAEIIIERNTTIPIVKSQEFTTYKDDQTGLQIHVVQGERDQVKDCRSLAQFELTDIPPMKAGMARIAITYQVDADGLLSVSAKEKTTGKMTHITVKPSYGLTEDEVQAMLKASYEHAGADVAVRSLTEKRVEAEQLLEFLTIALKQDGEKYLSPEELTDIKKPMQQLMKALNTGDVEKIKMDMEALDQASQTFAHRRMDGNLREAISGKSLNEVNHADD